MHNLILDIEKGNFKCDKLKWRNFDFFGTMRGFHIRGFYKFQTKVGSFFTFFYLAMVCCAIAYYLKKFNDTTRPRVQYNAYNHQKFADFYPAQKEIHFYFIPTTPNGDRISYKEFWEEYH